MFTQTLRNPQELNGSLINSEKIKEAYEKKLSIIPLQLSEFNESEQKDFEEYQQTYNSPTESESCIP